MDARIPSKKQSVEYLSQSDGCHLDVHGTGASNQTDQTNTADGRWSGEEWEQLRNNKPYLTPVKYQLLTIKGSVAELTELWRTGRWLNLLPDGQFEQRSSHSADLSTGEGQAQCSLPWWLHFAVNHPNLLHPNLCLLSTRQLNQNLNISQISGVRHCMHGRNWSILCFWHCITTVLGEVWKAHDCCTPC